ncbi:hypothetical protein QBC45DRAFT_242034 [Copromyces sp. CBS 386.78]|nr:hypothetical protein QBC45DRAFT_242034 [Copromyces sp. CBS 386.78]
MAALATIIHAGIPGNRGIRNFETANLKKRLDSSFSLLFFFFFFIQCFSPSLSLCVFSTQFFFLVLPVANPSLLYILSTTTSRDSLQLFHVRHNIQAC